MYNIQAQQGKSQWVTITTHAEESEAKRMARLLSVENNTPHRVTFLDEETQVETPVIAYDWGKPFIETEGVQTFVPSYYESLANDDGDDDTPLVFY
ncbi:MAG TPA: hypothetical protein PLZ51_17230, partial [Aggregatilineales bacterium]|nr:hypothetical protein [Aggregatilineales bacterium]